MRELVDQVRAEMQRIVAMTTGYRDCGPAGRGAAPVGGGGRARAERGDNGRDAPATPSAPAAGANASPLNPGQQAEPDAARVKAGALRAELEEARADGDRVGQNAWERAAEAAQGRERAA